MNLVYGDYNLELKLVDENRVYLNFWDYINGKDICCQIIDNKIMKFVYSPKEVEEDELEDESKIEDIFEQKEISLTEFIEMVKDSILDGIDNIQLNPQK